MITRLRTRNFKSLRNVDFTLGPLTVLVGPNMGGKSNVLDALRFIYDCWVPAQGVSGLWNAFTQRGGPEEVIWKGTDERLLSFSIEAGDPKDEGRTFHYELELLGGVGGFSTLQKESLDVWQDGQKHALMERESGPGTCWLLNSSGQRLGASVGPERCGMENAFSNWEGYALKAWAEKWRFYQLVPSMMKQANPMSMGQVLGKQGENLSAWLMWLQARSPQTFGRINEVAQDVFPDVQGLLTWPMQQGTVYLASQERELKRPTTLFQMSDGEVVFLALLSLIYSPPELSGSLFCIEEPENYLHPRLLRTFVELFRQARQASMASGSQPAQILITTQSPYLVDQMSLDEVVWVEKRKGETVAVRPGDKAHLRTLIENEDLGLADLMYSGALGED